MSRVSRIENLERTHTAGISSERLIGVQQYSCFNQWSYFLMECERERVYMDGDI